MLVQPTVSTTASYSGYAGRPVMCFGVDMLGVIRTTEPDIGAQVEYIDPQTGCIECAWVPFNNLNILAWPANCVDLSTVVPAEGQTSDFWSCGSINFMGAVQYIKAIAYYSYDYLQAINIHTVRVPGVHTSRLRSMEPEPEVYAQKNKQVLEAELDQVLAIA